MGKFDFIHSTKLKNILNRDFLELENIYLTYPGKSVLILAGSIIETVLLDLLTGRRRKANSAYLKLFKQKKRFKKKKIEDWNLDELIKVSVSLKILSKDIKQFSNIIKDYRNLIHPGREVRTDAKIDNRRAKVVYELVEIVLDEIEDFYAKKEGITPQYILNRLESDEKCLDILDHLLNELDEKGKRELFIMIPQRFCDIEFVKETNITNEIEVKNRLQICFRRLYSIVTKVAKKENVKNLVSLIKQNGNQDMINLYFLNFFTPKDLDLVSIKDNDIIVDYYLNWLDRAMKGSNNFEEERNVLPYIHKFSAYIPKKYRQKYFNLLLKLYLEREYSNYLIPRKILFGLTGDMQSDLYVIVVDKKRYLEGKDPNELIVMAKQLERINELEKHISEPFKPF